MGHAKRTVDTVAVVEFIGGAARGAVVLIMTAIAKIVRTEAFEKGRRTTVHTLPVNLAGTVLIANCRSTS